MLGSSQAGTLLGALAHAHMRICQKLWHQGYQVVLDHLHAQFFIS